MLFFPEECNAMSLNSSISQFVIDNVSQAVFFLDPDAHFLDANAATCKLFGYTHDELLQMQFTDIDEHFFLKDWANAWQEYKKLGSATFESNLTASDGKQLLVEVKTNYLVSEDQECICALVQDISERKHAEAALWNSDECFQSLVETTDEWIWAIDLNGNHTYSNPSVKKILGYSPEELIGKPSFTLLHEDDRKKVQAILPGHINDKTGWKGLMLRWLHKDGTYRYIESNATPFLDNSGEIIGFRGADRDVTDKIEANKILQAEQERARQYLDVSGAMILTLDTSGAVQMINRKGCEILGYPKEEILHRDWFENFLNPEVAESLKSAYEEFLTGHVEFIEYYENPVRSKGGDLRMIAWRNVLLKDSEGKVTGGLASGIDITDKKRAEEEAVQAEMQWNYAMDFFDDPIYLLDVNRHVIRANQAFYKMTHSTASDVIGRHVVELLHPEGEAVPCPVCRAQEELRDAVITMETEHEDNPAGVPIEVICRIIRDPDNNPNGIMMTIRDLSRARKTKERLSQSQAVFESTIEGIMITDTDLNITYVNPAFSEITGYSLDDVLGKNPNILKSSAQGPEFYKEMWDTINSGNVWRGSLTDKKKDGTYYPAIMSVTPIQDKSGKITHYVATQRDMTEYQRLEEQFRKAQKMEAIGTLVGGLAHDFNNMLSGIIGNTYFARQRAGDNKRLVENIDAIDKLSLRAADMIKQLLTFARKDDVAMHDFSLNSFLNEGIRLAQTSIPENIEQVLDISSVPMYVHGNTTQLQQIMMNLLNNARDALENIAHPKIVCSVHPYHADKAFKLRHPEMQSNTFALITVKDNGEGIRKDILDKIFEPFFSTKEVGKGTGLGLAMVYGAIMTHNGVVEIDSDIGEGTELKVYLPLVSSMEDEPSEDEAQLVKANGELVLLADDDETLREITEELLLHLGYKVITAVDGEDAITRFEENINDIALVILDIVMPRLDGVDAAEKIRRIKNNIPIIFATGYDRDEALKGHLRLENCAVLSKPFPLTQLNQEVSKLIGKGKG